MTPSHVAAAIPPLRALGRGAAGVLMAASSLRVQVMESKLSMSRSLCGMPIWPNPPNTMSADPSMSPFLLA
eukprot:CAMPEP_0173059156 /NCGR_PEP_ID=MMETSP1102-20130122/1791_1 /TAXON_ID=49646 /ORGANISM="Geminigera sp., Strain Caron Lab Isolate" /LENGTH=70 /DNA_ID=CAMNT_0013925055 /DNA_START=924 /DNA_END=1136 /DNA_ORIENTATION=-